LAESTLSLSFNGMANLIGPVFSYGADVTSFSAEQLAQVTAAISQGYRDFLFPEPLPGETSVHQWSFLHAGATLTANAPQSSSTVTIVDGVVTIASGTWPSWAAQGLLSISGTLYPVSTRDSSTQLTLFDTTLDADALTEYALYQGDIDAPDNFGGFDDKPTFLTPSSRNVELTIVDEQAIRAMRATPGYATGRPEFIAARVINATATTGQRWQFMLAPAPDAAYVWEYTHHVLPDMFATTGYPLGGAYHAQTILQGAYMHAARMLMNQEQFERKRADFQNRLAASVAHDRQRMTPGKLLTHRELNDYPTVRGPRANSHAYEAGV
jgi:hypothetical protein